MDVNLNHIPAPPLPEKIAASKEKRKNEPEDQAFRISTIKNALLKSTGEESASIKQTSVPDKKPTSKTNTEGQETSPPAPPRPEKS